MITLNLPSGAVIQALILLIAWTATPLQAAVPSTSGPQPPLTLSYAPPHWLVIHGEQIPAREIRVNYLEAYCRADSTDADWDQHTVIPHRVEVISISDDRTRLRLRDTLADGVTVDHTIAATADEIHFELIARNPASTRSEAHWAQPCVRLADFTGFDPQGRDLDDYLPQCFIFLEGRLTRLSEVRPWATEARYTPGQVWCPNHVPRTDVNPRPLSPLVPSNGLIGVFSRDEQQIFATAWEPYQELFQGVIRCVHSDFRLGGLRPGETKQIRGRIYLVPNNVPALLARYARDFPEHQPPVRTADRSVTSLANPDVRYTVPEKPYTVLRRAGLEVVVVDNRSVNDAVLPNHAARYHGIAALRHSRQPRNLFVPAYAGLNFEHIHDGTVQSREILFEPRHAPMELRLLNEHTAELYQAPTPHWGLESCMRYELLDGDIVELTFECIPRRDTYANSYIGLFWASYIDQPESLDIHFRGVTDPGDGPSGWLRGVTPAHGTLATHRGLRDHRQLVRDPAFPLELPFGFSRLRYAEPWYFGVARGMAWVQMFRPEDRVWLSQSPSGGGSGCPAWDFQWFIPRPEVGQCYQLKMRAAYLPLDRPQDLDSVREQVLDTVSRSRPESTTATASEPRRPEASVSAESPRAGFSDRVVAFYYPWYGNPETDGRYSNWNHAVAVRNEPPRSYPGGHDIGANFYPALGCYSVNDPTILREHLRQLRQARVGALCVSWWGRDTFTDRALPGIFQAAENAGVRINFHIEPFPGRTAASTREAIAYLVDRFGDSPALHRWNHRGNRPVFFIYDSYLTPAHEWASILKEDGARTLRGTKADSVVIGLWVKEHEGSFLLDGGFDGFYTYFATDGFTFGSTVSNWSHLADWARANEKLFVPCVAPGYLDTRIRPWNGVNTRDREAGAYYDRSWSAALSVSPELVGITSFNEWHEGTQIEPAVPRQIPGFTYLDYQPLPPDYYLDRTAHWIREWQNH